MGIMLVYDVTNSKSFDNIAKWLRNIQEHSNPDVEKMILGNKCDMEDRRVVSKGGFFFRNCDSFFKSPKTNIPKSYPELKI